MASPASEQPLSSQADAAVESAAADIVPKLTQAAEEAASVAAVNLSK